MSIFQELRQLLLLALQLRVAANVFLADEDIWDRTLMSHVFEGVLNFGAVVDLIELDDVGFHAHVAEERFGGVAVRAVGFREDS